MEKSTEINEVAKALSSVQSELKDLKRDLEGYGYSYADLGQCLKIIRPILHKYNLSVAQLVGGDEGNVSLESILMHSSGQWLSSKISAKIEKQNKMTLVQSLGSTVTYLRRYSLTSMLGIAQVDNDGAGDYEEELLEEAQIKEINYRAEAIGISHQKICDAYGVSNITQIPKFQYEKIIAQLANAAQRNAEK